MRETPMNVLFIVTDQHRAKDVGFMGNKVVATPHLDAFAAEAMVFDNAWVSNPVCMPNRATMLTGRLPSAHGVVFNDRSLDWNVNTVARQFKAAGYATGLLGKSHLQHGMSRNAVLAYRGQGSSRSPFAEGWDTVEDGERYLRSRPEDPIDFYGFDHIELSIDHGACLSGHHLQWAVDQGGDPSILYIDQDTDMGGSDRSQNWRQIYRPPYPEAWHSTHYVTERTLEFIRSQSARRQPFFAWCSYPDPHHPMTPPGRFFDMYRPEDMPLPESRHDKLEGAPAHLRHFASIHPKDQRNWVAPCGYGSDALLGEAIAATYGMISMIDEGVGLLMTALREGGLLDHTLIVFTSDHGDMMGEHGLFLKGFMHYRGTLQVPLAIRCPGLAAGRTDALATTLDLAPTLLDLAGLKAFDGMQGHSLRETLDHQSAIRDHVLIEDDLPIVTASLTPIPARTRTLVTPQYRYSVNSKGEEQVFDLIEDPEEMKPLSPTDGLAAELRGQLVQAMMMADDSSRGAPTTEQFALD